MNTFLGLIVFFILSTAWSAAQEKAPSASLLNEVLFSEGGQSWTLRDLHLYQKLIRHLEKKEKLSELSEDTVDDFLMSRLLKREAVLFEIQPEKKELTSGLQGNLSEFSKTEILQEEKSIAYAQALLNLKEKQLSQKVRFKAWLDVLKRKYAVKIKAHEAN